MPQPANASHTGFRFRGQRRSWPGATAIVLAGVAAGGLVACKKEASAKPAGLPAAPGAAAAPAGGTGPVAGPAPSPGASHGVRTLEIPEVVPPPPPDPRVSIIGKLVLPKARRADVGRGDTIFLMARGKPVAPDRPGPLVAVVKLEAKEFPQEFALTPANVMMPGVAWEGEMTLTVRVDKDGDPITRRKGDVVGEKKGVKVGTEGVELILADVLAADEAPVGTGGPMVGGGHGTPGGHGMGAPPAGAAAPVVGGEMPAGHPSLPAGHP